MSYKSKKLLPYLLILPVVIVICVLYLYPISFVIFHSFRKTELITGMSTFIGFDNFNEVVFNATFLDTLILTSKYTILTVFLKLSIGFVMALFLSSELYFSKFFRFLTLIPWAIQQVTVAIVWKWILDSNYGYLNYYLKGLGIISDNIAWLSDPQKAFIFASIVDTWMGVSLISMIFLAGLNSIDKNLYESAMIDGANIIHRFFSITCVGIKKVFLVTSMLVTIWTFNSFNVIFVLTAGGPMRSTETLIIKIYQEAFSRFNIGTSSALSMVVVFLLIIFISVYLYLLKNIESNE